MQSHFDNLNELTNFREIQMGIIASGVLYRGSYPIFKIDQQRDEAYDKLVSEAGINCVLSLAEDENGIKRLADLKSWYRILEKKGNVIGLDIQFGFDFENEFDLEVFNYKLRQGFQFMLKKESPYLIHCNAGRDRTGFVAAILELLCGATIDDVIYDYLLSYGKYFANAQNDELNYITGQIIYGQLNAILKRRIKDTKNLQSNIEKYFLEDIKLSENELLSLKKKLILIT